MVDLSGDPMSGVFAMAVFGFTGSLHCAGMCGPIAASCSRRGKVRDVALYHLSRIASYAIIGLVLGLISASILASSPTLQNIHSRYIGLILGSLMLVYATIEMLKVLGWWRINTTSKPWFQRFIRNLPLTEPVVLGIATALLPCGFLYAALLQAAVLAHPIYSAGGMILFAVSTGPALGIGGAVFLWLRKRWPQLAPWISVAALLIAGLAIIFRSLPNEHKHHHDINSGEQSPTESTPHHR